MKQFIIGTAGHIDHGKTSLIRALTNIDCDTHPEEKKRGITINLGFAYIPIGDDDFLAFIDVPGHHKFIGNMVAGASGIDFVMLVIAADDGVMPQTKEHLKICSLLGIKQGVVVVNKCDAVDEDYLDMCCEEIEEFVEGSFLEGEPMFRVSSLTGKGVDELKNYLIGLDISLYKNIDHDVFRMSIDRSFNVSGIGAVVTGTVSQGEVSVGDKITLQPKATEVKVRSIQRHNTSVERVGQGSRVAIDITGAKREDITMGDILSQIPLETTMRIDASIVFINKPENSKFDAILLCGTSKRNVKVKIMDCDESGNALAQIDLLAKWHFAYGDRFVMRNSSSDETLGGGVVVDPISLNHKNIKPELISNLKNIIDNPVAYVEYKIKQSISPLNIAYFSSLMQISETRLEEMIQSSKRVRVMPDKMLVNSDKYQQFEELILTGFKKFIKSNPLSVIGIPRQKLVEFAKDIVFYRDATTNDKIISLILGVMESEGKLERLGSNWQMPGMRLEISDAEQANIDKVKGVISTFDYNSFKFDEIISECRNIGIHERDMKFIINYLIDIKWLIKKSESYFIKEKLDFARNALINYLKGNDGIKVADYRDLLNCNRKVALLLLENFDAEKLVMRDGDVRRLN